MASQRNTFLKVVTSISGLFLIVFDYSSKLWGGCDEGTQEIKARIPASQRLFLLYIQFFLKK